MTVGSGSVRSIGRRQIRKCGEVDGLIDEHDRDVVPDGIGLKAVISYEKAVERCGDRFPGAIDKNPRLGRVVHARQKTRVRENHRAVGLGTDENVE
jgi:hypothetical protein